MRVLWKSYTAAAAVAGSGFFGLTKICSNSEAQSQSLQHSSTSNTSLITRNIGRRSSKRDIGKRSNQPTDICNTEKMGRAASYKSFMATFQQNHSIAAAIAAMKIGKIQTLFLGNKTGRKHKKVHKPNG
jgi:hypothetical protein